MCKIDKVNQGHILSVCFQDLILSYTEFALQHSLQINPSTDWTLIPHPQFPSIENPELKGSPLKAWSRSECGHAFTFTFIRPFTAGVVGAPQMTSQPLSSIFPCSPLSSGTRRTPGLSIPWCCLPTFFTLKDGFSRTR